VTSAKITPGIIAARQHEFDAAFKAVCQEVTAAHDLDPAIIWRTEVCRRLRDQGWTLGSIGQQFSLTSARISQILMPHRQDEPGDRLELDRIRAMADGGAPDREIAAALGTTRATVAQRRRKHGISPGQTPNKDIRHGLSAYRRGCRCGTCITAYRSIPSLGAHYKRNSREIKRNMLRRKKAEQSATLPGAVRLGELWTLPELKLAADPALTAVEIAAMTGRTLFGVQGARQRLRMPDGSLRIPATTPLGSAK
jgi:hypothetical protein